MHDRSGDRALIVGNFFIIAPHLGCAIARQTPQSSPWHFDCSIQGSWND
jgi:hypothetical protein